LRRALLFSTVLVNDDFDIFSRGSTSVATVVSVVSIVSVVVA